MATASSAARKNVRSESSSGVWSGASRPQFENKAFTVRAACGPVPEIRLARLRELPPIDAKCFEHIFLLCKIAQALAVWRLTPKFLVRFFTLLTRAFRLFERVNLDGVDLPELSLVQRVSDLMGIQCRLSESR